METSWHSLKLLDGLLPPTIINLGGSFMQKGTPKAGKDFLTCWLRVIKCGLESAALVVLISRKSFEYNGKPSVTHQLDAGAAWENLALEACFRGIVTHGMEGFDYQRTRQELEIPEDYDVMAMIAIGKRGPKEKLPPPLRDRESPTDRKPLTEIVMEGKYRP